MWNELGTGITQFLDTYGLIAIFVVMLLKEIGIPVPIPSDLIMLLAAAQSAAGTYVLWEAFGAILIAMVVGAWAQYVLVRGLGRSFLYRFGRYIGLPPARLDSAATAVRRGGAIAVAVSLLTPGVRIATVPACGLAKLPYRSFLPAMIASSAIFLALHFVVGYAGGPIVGAAMSAINVPMLVLFVALLAAGLGGWMLIRRRSRLAKQPAVTVTLEHLRDWADASCHLCLVLGAVHHLRRTEDPESLVKYRAPS